MRAKKWLRLPPLAVGIGIYLPMSATLPVVSAPSSAIGTTAAPSARRTPSVPKRLGVLVASGMIVGESLFGVILAGLIVATSSMRRSALVGDGYSETTANMVGLAAFAALIVLLYGWMLKKSRAMAPRAPK